MLPAKVLFPGGMTPCPGGPVPGAGSCLCCGTCGAVVPLPFDSVFMLKLGD